MKARPLFLVSLLLVGLRGISAPDPELMGNYEQRMDALQDQRDTALKRLHVLYLGALERGVRTAEQAGDLDALTAFLSERDRFNREPKVTEILDTPCELSELQETFVQQEGVVLKSYYEGYLETNRILDQILERQERELVRSGNTTDAKAVREVRDTLAGSEDMKRAQNWSELNPDPESDMAQPAVPVGDPVYLSTLEIADRKRGHGEIGFGFMSSPDAKIMIAGEAKPHSLGLHPPHSDAAWAEFDLEGNHRLLEGAVVIHESGHGGFEGPTGFRIRGDGEVLWESRPFTSETMANAEAFRVSLVGVSRLRLETFCIGSHNFAHNVFVDPQLY